MLRALTLMADWQDAAGSMVVSLPWCVVILAWTAIIAFLQDKLRLGRIGSRIVLGIGFVGLCLLSGWMYTSGIARNIGGYLMSPFVG